MTAHEDRGMGDGIGEPGLPRVSSRGGLWLSARAVLGGAIAPALALVLLSSCGTEAGDGTPTPEASVPATRSAGASATADPSPTPSPEPTAAPAWELARATDPTDDPARSANFMGVQWHEGPGWVAFGSQGSNEGAPPSIWTSADGKSWAPAELPSDLDGTPVLDIAMADLDGGSRFVAVLAGYIGTSRILTSDDATSWEPATTPETGTQLEAVAWGPAGFVAIGTLGDGGQPSRAGRVWQSADGTAWEESAPADLKRAGPLDLAVLDDRYVAVGFPQGSGPPLVSWVSVDGAVWAQHEVSPASDLGCLCAVADAAAGLIVTLFTAPTAQAAVSDDGEAWEVMPIAEDAGPELTGADVVEDGAMVAIGFVPALHASQDTLVFVRDADATDWRAVDWQAELGDRAAGVNGRAFVAVGPERTLILFANGDVVLTADRLP